MFNSIFFRMHLTAEHPRRKINLVWFITETVEWINYTQKIIAFFKKKINFVSGIWCSIKLSSIETETTALHKDVNYHF